jgi:hypothetical protein
VGQRENYPYLRGLKTVAVLVRDLTPDAQPCGVTRSTIETAAAKTLLNNGIGVEPAETALWIEVRTIHVKLAALCVSDVRVELLDLGGAAMPSYWSDKNPPARIRLVLDHGSSILSSSLHDHLSSVLADVWKWTEAIATDIRLANGK